MNSRFSTEYNTIIFEFNALEAIIFVTRLRLPVMFGITYVLSPSVLDLFFIFERHEVLFKIIIFLMRGFFGVSGISPFSPDFRISIADCGNLF